MIASDRLQAPRDDGGVLALPPLAEVGALVSLNRRRFAAGGVRFLGRSWSELRRVARSAVLESARQYLLQAGEPLPDLPPFSSQDEPRILMAGHQPELFHPGVWVKNFALQGLAKKHGCVAVNLVVDNDTAKSTSLRLPGLRSSQPYVASVPYDLPSEEIPYEERQVRDESLFASFPDRVAALSEGWNFAPLLDPFWREVLFHSKPGRPLGERFAGARRAWERRWGCHNLEVPVSAVCRTESFAWFALHLLTGLADFHAVYNDCVHGYRKRYGIRSRNHPVPDLGSEGDWLETPFWAWKAGSSRRGRLFARREGSTIHLRVGTKTWPSLPVEPSAAITAWQSLESAGFKIRSRALTNTLFARLFLCDLFLHGIGGGKYDELTDDLIRRFYHVEPPAYLVFSATLLLPFPSSPTSDNDCGALQKAIRDLHWNPQRHLGEQDFSSESVRELVRQKESWITRVAASRAARRERYQALRQLTKSLQPLVAAQTADREEALRRCNDAVRANSVLRRRDFAFCLYPEEQMREFCGRFSHEADTAPSPGTAVPGPGT